MQAPTFAISVAASASDNRPLRLTLTLDTLCERLTTFRHRPDVVDKRELAGWVPAQFDGGRKAERAIALSCLVLDFDKGLSPDEARAPWLDWTHIVHPSWSHRPAHPKFRLVLPLATPVPRRCWASAWTWAWERTNRTSDVMCKDPGRLYFLPAVRDDGHPRFCLVHRTAALLSLKGSEPPPVVRRPPPPVTVPRTDAERIARARLNGNPDVREAFARGIGAEIAGEEGHPAAGVVR